MTKKIFNLPRMKDYGKCLTTSKRIADQYSNSNTAIKIITKIIFQNIYMCNSIIDVYNSGRKYGNNNLPSECRFGKHFSIGSGVHAKRR
jgi:hypothetical protein